jgi:hypothetical protein
VSGALEWLSKDPIGIAGGLNQYVFCGNNPVNFRDPLGLVFGEGEILGPGGLIDDFLTAITGADKVHHGCHRLYAENHGMTDPGPIGRTIGDEWRDSYLNNITLFPNGGAGFTYATYTLSFEK